MVKNTGIKENQLSNLDMGSVLKDAHNQEGHSLDVTGVNSLIPVRYSKVSLSYREDGCGIETATYYDGGEKFNYSFDINEFPLGLSEITTLSFLNITPSSLDGKYFKIYDDNGSVGVWFDLDNGSVAPTTGATRDIEIDIATGDTEEQMATKLATKIDLDSLFSASSTTFLTVIASSSIGSKTNASKETSGLFICIRNGQDSLNSKRFMIYSSEDETTYCVWYNVDDAGMNPCVTGVTGIEVVITTGDTSTVIATSTAAAITAISDFTSSGDGITVEIINQKVGETTDPDITLIPFSNYIIIQEGEDLEIVAQLEWVYDNDDHVISMQRI